MATKEEWAKAVRDFYEKLRSCPERIEEITKEITETLEILKSKEGKNVLELLLERGYIFHGDLANILNLEPIHLKTHLNVLMRYALVYMKYSANSFNANYLHYELSNLGKKLMQEIYCK